MKPRRSTRRARCQAARAAWRHFALVLLLVVTVPATMRAQDTLTFVAVTIDDLTHAADNRLTEYLRQRTGIVFRGEEGDYERVIDRLVNWRPDSGFFLARMTPYAYLVSELLGADVEPLATYVGNATGRTTYHAYFVVNRQQFPTQPTLTDIVSFLARHNTRARFAYHNQFSTSSYFLPLLFFRANKIFHMPSSMGSLIAIGSERFKDIGSSGLVQRVALGQADVAAVWDDTKAKFESAPGRAADPAGDRVYFVQLPTAIPNDLLVSSASLDPQVKERMRAALRTMGPNAIATGDFNTWQDLDQATDARLALADLRWLARERPPPVTVDVQVTVSTPASRRPVFLEAARQALRLSGTELVLYDQDYHKHVDIRWTLEAIHDGAVSMRCAIVGSSNVEPQVFRLSFRDTEDLSRRIVSLVHTRMHRIRYVWPFSGTTPMILRDIAVALPEGADVPVEKITWLDPERNRFETAGTPFGTRIRHATYYRYELAPENFRVGGQDAMLDPMSNAGYRVILVHPAEQPFLFRFLTVALVGAFVLSAVAAVWDLARPKRRRSQAPPLAGI